MLIPESLFALSCRLDAYNFINKIINFGSCFFKNECRNTNTQPKFEPFVSEFNCSIFVLKIHEPCDLDQI